MNWKNLLLTNIPRDGEAGAGAGDAAAVAAAAAAAAAAKPWYDGKADAETVGHWDNKGWKKDDPAVIAIEATKAAREAQKFVGLPADRLIRLPEKPDDEAGWSGVHQRLGVPKEAKEYDFSAIKHADGSDITPALADALRAAALKAFVPKDRAAELVKAVVGNLDSQKAEQSAVFTAKLAEEKTTLAKNWGTTPDKLDLHTNMLLARQGAARLGISVEAVKAWESQVGYAGVMDAMRKIGAGTSEDAFHEGGGRGGNPTTLAGAQARLNELMADKAWGARLVAGDAAAKAEWLALTTQIAA